MKIRRIYIENIGFNNLCNKVNILNVAIISIEKYIELNEFFGDKFIEFNILDQIERSSRRSLKKNEEYIVKKL